MANVMEVHLASLADLTDLFPGRITQAPGQSGWPGGWWLERAAVLGVSGLVALQHDDGRLFVLLDSNDYGREHTERILPAQVPARLPDLGLPGSYGLLHGPWASNFFHWVMEKLPQYLCLQATGFHGPWLTPGFALYEAQSLTALGVRPEMIFPALAEPFVVDRLLLPAPMAFSQVAEMPGLLDCLRQRLMAAAADHPALGEQLYIARSSRGVVNEADMRQALARRGVRPVVMEELDFLAQVAAVREARLLVGPHGAGMLHALFTRAPCEVIELFLPAYLNYTLLPIIRACRHGYRSLVGNATGNGLDIVLPLNVLDVMLDNLMPVPA